MRKVSDEMLRGIASSEGSAFEWMTVGDAVDALGMAAELLELREEAAQSARMVVRQGTKLAELHTCKARLAVQNAKLAAITQWLEDHQQDVFKRGLWDAISAAEFGAAE